MKLQESFKEKDEFNNKLKTDCERQKIIWGHEIQVEKLTEEI